MIWTAIFQDRTIKVFSTQYNSVDEARAYVGEYFVSPLFALIKGNHPDVKFF